MTFLAFINDTYINMKPSIKKTTMIKKSKTILVLGVILLIAQSTYSQSVPAKFAPTPNERQMKYLQLSSRLEELPAKRCSVRYLGIMRVFR